MKQYIKPEIAVYATEIDEKICATSIQGGAPQDVVDAEAPALDEDILGIDNELF